MISNIRKVSHHSKYVKDAIDALDMSQDEFVIRTGISSDNVNSLLDSNINVTYDIAEKLALFFDNSIDFWLDLQAKYDDYIKSIMLLNNKKNDIV